jgi:hypothetical protein
MRLRRFMFSIAVPGVAVVLTAVSLSAMTDSSPAPALVPAQPRPDPVYTASNPATSAAAAMQDNFPVVSPTADGGHLYRDEVDFVVPCALVKAARDDPIVYPAQPGASHLHEFSGNRGVNAASTPEQLSRQKTSCSVPQDLSSYWQPALLVNGSPVTPYTTRVYYRAGTTEGRKVHPLPYGLRMVAGDAMASGPQKTNVAAFQCRAIGRHAPVVGKQPTPPQCPVGTILAASVIFPDCWDGRHLDSADHKSHMSYGVGNRCDPAHPVMVSQVTVEERYAAGTTSGVLTLASMNSPFTLHADMLNAWAPSVMQQLTQRCINASVHCGDVSSKRFPPTR